MEGLVAQVPELVMALGLVLLAYKYGYWKGRVHGGRKVDPNKPKVSVIERVKKVLPHADPPPPAVTGMRRPEYTSRGIGEEEL